MKKLLLALMATLFCLATTSATATTLQVDKDRTVYLRGEVNGNAIVAAQQIIGLSNQSQDDIYMVINSPGGNVITGLQLLSAMRIAQERGIKIKCIVPNLAASMAFVTFAQCSERYAFDNSLLLWHPMRTSSERGFSREDAHYAEETLRRYEMPLLRLQRAALDVSWKFFMYHYKHETLWTGESLNKAAPRFMEIIDDVQGVDDLFALR